jgi:phosphatidylglycerophosphatase A
MGKKLNWLVATSGGIGLLPLAPGSWAAAFSGFLWLVVGLNTHAPGTYVWQCIILLVLATAGVYCSGKISNEKDKDPSYVVIDEVAGMWTALVFVNPGFQNLAAGFLLFRFFDIAKPLGIRRMEKLGKGWGIMLDDLLAGCYSNIILQLLVWLKLW